MEALIVGWVYTWEYTSQLLYHCWLMGFIKVHYYQFISDESEDENYHITFSKIVLVNRRVRPGAFLALCEAPYSDVIIEWNHACSVITQLDSQLAYTHALHIITENNDIQDCHNSILSESRKQQMIDCAIQFVRDIHQRFKLDMQTNLCEDSNSLRQIGKLDCHMVPHVTLFLYIR